MKIVFLTITSKLPPWLDEVTADYRKKLSFWTNAEFINLAAASHGRDSSDRKKLEEASQLLKFLRDDDFVLLCDEKGRKMSSVQFAKWLENVLGGGKKRIVVVIGGAYGVTDEVKKRADATLSLSDMTMNHHLALAVAAEQVYRGFTIIKNTSYHNA